MTLCIKQLQNMHLLNCLQLLSRCALLTRFYSILRVHQYMYVSSYATLGYSGTAKVGVSSKSGEYFSQARCPCRYVHR